MADGWVWSCPVDGCDTVGMAPSDREAATMRDDHLELDHPAYLAQQQGRAIAQALIDGIDRELAKRAPQNRAERRAVERAWRRQRRT